MELHFIKDRNDHNVPAEFLVESEVKDNSAEIQVLVFSCGKSKT